MTLEELKKQIADDECETKGPAGALVSRKVGGLGAPACRREDECGIISR